MSETVGASQVVAEPKKPKPRKSKRSLYLAFELAYDRIAVFRELLTTISEGFDDELPLQIQENAIAVRVMDPSRVKMANYLFTKDMFEEWQVTQQNHRYKMAPLPATITVPLKEVLFAFNNAGKDDKVRFEIAVVFSTIAVKTVANLRKPVSCPKCGVSTEDCYNRLARDKRGKKGNLFKCQCGWRGKVRRWSKKVKEYETEVEDKESKFQITVKEKTEETWGIEFLEGKEEEEIPLPKLITEAKFKIVAPYFRAKVERLGKRVDHIHVIGQPDKMILEGSSDIIAGKIELKRGSDMLLDISCHKEQKAVYSISQLLSILPKKTVAEVINLEFSKDMPIKITALTTLGDSTIEYYIAPRISTDE